MNDKKIVGIEPKALSSYRKHVFITIITYSIIIFFVTATISSLHLRSNKSDKKSHHKKSNNIPKKQLSSLRAKINRNFKKKITIKIADYNLEMVLIPPENQNLTSTGNILPFYMTRYEITQKLWKLVMKNNPSIFKGDKLPVNNISYDDIKKFIKKLNIMSEKKFGIPFETEWEFACRSGSKTIYYWGNFVDENFDKYCWYDKNSINYGNKSGPHEVGLKLPNNWGLYDMSGNVSEIVEKNPCSCSNVKKVTVTIYEVGGSWISRPNECRSSSRREIGRNYKKGHLGFRLVLYPENLK